MRSIRFKPALFALVPLAILALGFTFLKASAGNNLATPSISKELLVCGSCHSMATEVAGWEAGPHAAVACLECHSESDSGWVRHEFGDRNDEMASASNPHTLPMKTPNERCEACHDGQMESLLKDMTPQPVKAKNGTGTKPMTVLAKHDLHLNGKAKLNCVDCHAISAHGPAKDTVAYREEMHARCDACHTQQNVTLKATGSTSCTACHTEQSSVIPADHKNKSTWLASHGKATATQNCAQCHVGNTPEKNADACLSCHAGQQMPHPKSFLAQHGQRAITNGESCAACHSEKTPIQPVPAHAQPQFCADCHAGMTMPHPDAFLSSHGATAMQSPAVCQTCHSPRNPVNPTAPHASASNCAACHASYQHPQGWVANHGSQVDQGCATCHSTESNPGSHNACAACHTGKSSWHPNMWFVSHGRVVNQDGKAACMKCHDEVKPSCTQCHRDP